MLKQFTSSLLLILGTVSLTLIPTTIKSVNALGAVSETDFHQREIQSFSKTNLIAQKENPYSRLGYQATAYFKCSVGNADHDKMCPGGINRQENGQTTIVVLFPNTYEVQYDFKDGNVTTTFEDGKLDWGKVIVLVLY